MYFWLSSPPMMAEMRRLGTGAAIPGIPRRNLVTIPLLIPSDSELESFQSVAGPVVTKILFNSIESRTLATIRDTLLPRLISGELRMPDAEAQVEMTL